MKNYDVLLHRKANLEELKTVEIRAANEDEARREAARRYGLLDWVVWVCNEKQYVEGYQNFTVTE
ncbi:hypothetical protein [Gimesia fumaroli]|uniref:Uncharacterized protein n=1 Tax=Gimesia fumaroli TaxID=2527976 RepID=A0A518ICH9_9PLAN|nr:hypothetical protein [Gimesia fumaroli]QDV50815.1 hypothetical protein Enr17x_28600 [Gimesia fumaroli]